jgi:hypothetical protein
MVRVPLLCFPVSSGLRLSHSPTDGSTAPADEASRSRSMACIVEGLPWWLPPKGPVDFLRNDNESSDRRSCRDSPRKTDFVATPSDIRDKLLALDSSRSLAGQTPAVSGTWAMDTWDRTASCCVRGISSDGDVAARAAQVYHLRRVLIISRLPGWRDSAHRRRRIRGFMASPSSIGRAVRSSGASASKGRHVRPTGGDTKTDSRSHLLPRFISIAAKKLAILILHADPRSSRSKPYPCPALPSLRRA